MDNLRLRVLSGFLLALILVLFGLLEKKTGFPFLTNAISLTVIFIVYLILIVFIMIINQKRIREDDEYIAWKKEEDRKHYGNM